MLDWAWATEDRSLRRGRLGALAAGLVVMSGSLVWAWWADPLGWEAFPGSNAYVWLTLAVLVVLTQQIHGDACRRMILPVGQGSSVGA